MYHKFKISPIHLHSIRNSRAMYRHLASSSKLFRLFLLIITIGNFVVGTGATDDSYDDFAFGSRRSHGDLESSLPIVEQCTSGVPCNLLTGSIRVMVGLLNELETASKQHCPYRWDSEMASSMKTSRQIDSRSQQRNRRKPLFPNSSQPSNFGQSPQTLRQRDGSHFSRRQLFHQSPLPKSYRPPEFYRTQYTPGRTGQAYENYRPIETFSDSQPPPITHKSAADKSHSLDNALFTSDLFGIDGKRNKKKIKKPCSRRSNSRKKSVEPVLRIQEDATTVRPTNVTSVILDDTASPKTENYTVTTNPGAETDIPDEK